MKSEKKFWIINWNLKFFIAFLGVLASLKTKVTWVSKFKNKTKFEKRF